MDNPPPQYNFVLANLSRYPLYDPAIHVSGHGAHVMQSTSHVPSAPMPAAAQGTPNPDPAAAAIAAHSSATFATHDSTQLTFPYTAGSNEEDSDSGGPAARRWSSNPVLSSSSAGAALPFSRRSPTLQSSGYLPPDMMPATEEERRRRLAERLMDDPTAPSLSSRAPRAAASARGDAASLCERIDLLPVQAVKWQWEPDDGTLTWVPYDAHLCQKIERHFQLWILASSSTCSICESRRRTFPRDVSTIGNSFEHVFRPDLVWRFRFAVGRSGKIVHLQVRSHRPARLLCGISSGPHSQENVKTLSRRGIMRDDGVHISPDDHAHLPDASSTEWAPDATEKVTTQRGRGH
jgi:hypothetical protein